MACYTFLQQIQGRIGEIGRLHPIMGPFPGLRIQWLRLTSRHQSAREETEEVTWFWKRKRKNIQEFRPGRNAMQ